MESEKSLDIISISWWQKFQTLRKTLQSVPDTFFSGMLECVEEKYFIDRDGKHFGQVLNYLRGSVSIDQVDPDDVLFYSLPGKPTAKGKRLYTDEVKLRRLAVKEYLARHEDEIWATVATLYRGDLDIHFECPIFHDRQLHNGTPKTNGVVIFIRSKSILKTRRLQLQRGTPTAGQTVGVGGLSLSQVDDESVPWRNGLCKLVQAKHHAQCTTQFYVMAKYLEAHFARQGMKNEMKTYRENYNYYLGFRIEWTFLFSESPLWISEVLSTH
jgi:hypothetical protein